ncbi:MAG: cobalamin-binding protein [Acidobacteria bacterium]|nr:cobalamin-binding protein [Acidobacteriota bacterium]
MRIVSLIASSTEITCALGMEEYLVGRSHECDYPPSVLGLPVCSEPKFPTNSKSSEIDECVKGLLEQALSVYRVDSEKLRQLQPTHILTQTQCDVCAVNLRDVEEAVQTLVDSKPQIVSLHPNALSDLWKDIERVAEALEVPERAQKLISDLQSRMSAIERRTVLLSRPTVACIEWIEPLMASGNWMPELVHMSGGQNLFGEPGIHAPRLEWCEVVDADPDILLILPCGLDIQRTRKELQALTRKPDWTKLAAVRSGNVYLLDGNQYFNRPGPRLAESLEILAEIFHPEYFAFGHEGKGWERLPRSQQ